MRFLPRERDRSRRVIEAVVDASAAAIAAMHGMHGSRQMLVGTGEADVVQDVEENVLLEAVGHVGAIVEEHRRVWDQSNVRTHTN